MPLSQKQPKQVPTGSCQRRNSQGPTPLRLHAERKQWLISLATHETMCHHANTVQPQGPGFLNELHPTRINQTCPPWKPVMAYCPLFSHSGMQKEAGKSNRRDAFSTFVRQTSLNNNKCVSLAAPLLSSKVPLSLCSSLGVWGVGWVHSCIPDSERRIEYKKMAWAMEKSGRRPWQRAMWAGKEGRAL